MLTEAELLAEGEIDPGEEGQWCTRCGILKPVCDYYNWSTKKNPQIFFGARPECKACVNGRTKLNLIRRVYGLTPDEHAKLHESGCCDICGGRSDNMHTDHDHATGKVRGALCVNCNLGVGNFKDSPELLLKAAAYLGYVL